MISKDQIQEFSERLAIDEFTVIREYIQIVFLSNLYSAKESQNIYFKGGTAIRLLLQSGRFSEDLDFTAELSAKELDEIVNDTVKKVGLVVPGVTLKRIGENQYSYILSYQPEDAKHALKIDLDFSLRERPETSRVTVLETELPVVPQPVIKHIDWQEILAEKIRAFLTRPKDHKRGRDIYDLWFLMSKGVAVDWEMVNRKTKMYGIKTSFGDLIERVSDFDDKKLKNDLGKFLPAYDRGLVEQLKERTIKQIVSRQSFTIRDSENLAYTKVPGHSFSGADKFLEPEDMRHTKIVDVRRRDENSIIVQMVSADGIEANAYIRAQSRNGVIELDVIEANVQPLKGKSYDDLINHQFTS